MQSNKIPKAVKNIWEVIIDHKGKPLSAKEIAEVLDLQTNSIIQTVRRYVQFFRVHGKKPIYIGLPLRPEVVYLRDKNQCFFCGKTKSTNKLNVDFINEKDPPILTNSITTCNSCKNLKDNRPFDSFVANLTPKKKQNKILEKLNYVRSFTTEIPSQMSKKRPGSPDAYFEALKEMQEAQRFSEIMEEVEKLRSLLQEAILPNNKDFVFSHKWEYLTVNFGLWANFPESSHEDILYWKWDYDWEKKSAPEDAWWYISNRGKITHQGRPQETGLEDILDRFGEFGWQLVNFRWDAEDSGMAIFKRPKRGEKQ
ncbi:MAG: hypothetical protein ACFFBD_26805 [Candidatus Hodarchaeota archaeon]